VAIVFLLVILIVIILILWAAFSPVILSPEFRGYATIIISSAIISPFLAISWKMLKGNWCDKIVAFVLAFLGSELYILSLNYFSGFPLMLNNTFISISLLLSLIMALALIVFLQVT